MKLQLAKFFASVIFIGKFPLAPGTFASLIANLSLYLILLYHNQASIDLRLLMAFLVPFLFFAGVFTSSIITKEINDKDPSSIVIDEWVGQWIPFIFLHLNFQNLVLSFIFFRIFDISKILFIKKFESFSGGWGVMLDDVLAGFYALVLVIMFNQFI